MAFIILFVFVVVIASILGIVRRYNKAVRDDEIRFLCPQFGFTYLDEVPVAQLGPLTEPPWTAFLGGLERDTSQQTLTVRRTNGSIFSGQFQGVFYRFRIDLRTHVVSERCSVACLKLLDPGGQRHLVDFVLALNLKNGLHVVVRGNDIYAMFGPRWRRPMEMTYREQMKCMSAMLRMLDGDLARAQELFGEISGASVGRVTFSTLVIGGALALWAWIIKANDYTPLAVLVPALVVGLSFSFTWVRHRNDDAQLRSYLVL